jgi:hypothetical protein
LCRVAGSGPVALRSAAILSDIVVFERNYFPLGELMGKIGPFISPPAEARK